MISAIYKFKTDKRLPLKVYYNMGCCYVYMLV